MDDFAPFVEDSARPARVPDGPYARATAVCPNRQVPRVQPGQVRAQRRGDDGADRQAPRGPGALRRGPPCRHRRGSATSTGCRWPATTTPRCAHVEEAVQARGGDRGVPDDHRGGGRRPGVRPRGGGGRAQSRAGPLAFGQCVGGGPRRRRTAGHPVLRLCAGEPAPRRLPPAPAGAGRSPPRWRR